MSKQLLIMRHATAAHADGTTSDFERPLNHRGIGEARKMAKFICHQGLTPCAVVSSSAVRTKMTSQLLVKHCKGLEVSHVNFAKAFYLVRASGYLKFLDRFKDDLVSTLMFVGHNPGLEELLELVTGQRHSMAPGTIVLIDLIADSWADIEVPVKGTLVDIWRPDQVELDHE